MKLLPEFPGVDGSQQDSTRMLLFRSPPPSPIGLRVGQSARSRYRFSLPPLPALRKEDNKRTANMGSKAPTITTGLSIGQVHHIAGSVNAAVKNATEAEKYLAGKGWMAPGESPTLDILARVLFATMVHSKNLPWPASTSIAAVTYLLTAKQEEGLLERLTDITTLHIKDTLDSVMSNLHVKLDQHIKSIGDAAQIQNDLTNKLAKTQETLEETAQKAITTTKTYSQVAATTPTFTQTPAPPVLIGQIRV